MALPFTAPGGETGVTSFAFAGKTGPSQRFSRSALKTGAAQSFRPTGGGFNVTITIQGLETVTRHFEAVAAFTPELLFWGANVMGQEAVKGIKASIIEQNIWDTGDTHNSVHHSMFTSGDAIWTDAGPTTFYAPWLEFGTVKMNARPFVTRDFDNRAAAWTAYCGEILALADRFGPVSNPFASDPQVRSVLSRIRGFLYTEAKALGDISVLFGRGFISPVRAQMYRLGRILGDVSASMNGAVGSRFATRLRGKVTGRLIGVGAASISANTPHSALIGGPAGHRIYTRVVGKHSRFIVTGRGVSL